MALLLSLMNFSGLGILEYLEFFEDTNMEPIMAVWDGYALASGGSSVPPNQLGPYVQQAIDQVSFVYDDSLPLLTYGLARSTSLSVILARVPLVKQH